MNKDNMNNRRTITRYCISKKGIYTLYYINIRYSKRNHFYTYKKGYKLCEIVDAKVITYYKVMATAEPVNSIGHSYHHCGILHVNLSKKIKINLMEILNKEVLD
jgi:hypothetical protein